MPLHSGLLPQVAGPLSCWHGDGHEKLFQKHGFYVRARRLPGGGWASCFTLVLAQGTVY